jgi:hypothetical protein
MTKEPASYRIRPKLKKEIDSYLSLLKAQGHIEDYGEMLEICFPLIQKKNGHRKVNRVSKKKQFYPWRGLMRPLGMLLIGYPMNMKWR